MASTLAFLTLRSSPAASTLLTSSSSLLLRTASATSAARGLSLSAALGQKEVYKRDKPHVNIGEREN